MKLKIFIDGASRGNPGPGAIGVVIQDSRGKVLEERGKFLGRCTNNEAEYTALVTALEMAHKLKGTELAICSDSELLVRQFEGIYRLKKPELIQLMGKVRRLVSKFRKFSLTHVRREFNKTADRLANQALDKSPGPSGKQLLLFA